MLYEFKEHQSVLTSQQLAFKGLAKDINLCESLEPHNKKYVGLQFDWQNKDYKAGYYIGLDWLDEENEHALCVEPKIYDLDFTSMFMACFESRDQELTNRLSEVYHIDYTRPLIEVPSNKNLDVTPLLIVHFLKMMEILNQKRLKHNYVEREENLSCKINGRVLLSKTIKKNILNRRLDRNYCRYEEVSEDCIENRVLKRALVFVSKYMSRHQDITARGDLNKVLTRCMECFKYISDDVTPAQVLQYRANPLFRQYATALKLAKMILRHFAFDLDNTIANQVKHLPPFWIDMPILFELYVLHKLREGKSKIIYHKRTYGNEINMIKVDENLIIDAKYILDWSGSKKHDNVRQLSGYARNRAIRRVVLSGVQDDASTILPCLIIHPEQGENGKDRLDFEKLLDYVEDVKEYIHFYVMGLKLPIKDSL